MKDATKEKAVGLARFLLLAYQAYRGDPAAALKVLQQVKTTAEKVRDLD